jgi:uncharacterized phage-associated protein
MTTITTVTTASKLFEAWVHGPTIPALFYEYKEQLSYPQLGYGSAVSLQLIGVGKRHCRVLRC